MIRPHIFDVWRKPPGETTLGEDRQEPILYREGIAGFYVVRMMATENDEVAESVEVLTPCIFTSIDTPVIKGDEIRNIRWRNEESVVPGTFEVKGVRRAESASRFSKHGTIIMKESV